MITPTARLLLSAGLLAATLCACSRAPTAPGDRVVARIGGETVTASDFESAMRRRGGDVPEVFTNVANRRALLDEIVRVETLAEAARRGGFFERPEVRQAAQRQAIQLFQESVRAGVPAPTDEEVAERYAGQRERYGKPARVRLAVIRMDRPAAVRARAEQARAEALALTNTPHFGAVAAAYSDDQATRYRGGDAGWVRTEGAAARFPASVLAAAGGPSGAVSDVIEERDAFYLVKAMERAAAEPLPLDLVRENIRIELAKERGQRALDEQLARSAVKVWIDEQLLASLPVPPPPPGAEKRRQPPAPPAD